MALRVSDPDHVVNFREMVKESSWGLLPPTITFETTSVRGWEKSGTHVERSPSGGGKVDFSQVREAVHRAIVEAGWTFHLEGGRAP